MEHRSNAATEQALPEHIACLSDGTRAWYARTYAQILGLTEVEQADMHKNDEVALQVFHRNIHKLAVLIPEYGD